MAVRGSHNRRRRCLCVGFPPGRRAGLPSVVRPAPTEPLHCRSFRSRIFFVFIRIFSARGVGACTWSCGSERKFRCGFRGGSVRRNNRGLWRCSEKFRWNKKILGKINKLCGIVQIVRNQWAGEKWAHCPLSVMCRVSDAPLQATPCRQVMGRLMS